ncbi:MAG: DUF86 domain-containing protein [Syntrophales bacterium]|nr:DUF86 domain-containing protein [Syntrophales bacterium]
MNLVIFNKIERLKEELKYLTDHKNDFLRTIKTSIETKKIVERSVYLCAEIALDIADLIIIKKGFPKPATYSDSLYKLGDYGIIPREFAYHIVYLAGLRNFLAHDYQKSTIPELERFLRKGLKDIKQYSEEITKGSS